MAVGAITASSSASLVVSVASATTSFSTLVFLENLGTGSFRSSITIYNSQLTGAFQNIVSMRLSDLDGDGDLDLVCGCSDNKLAFFESRLRNGGTGTASPFIEGAATVRSVPGAGLSMIQVADVDDDGAPDILVTSFSGNAVYLFKNLDDASLGLAASFGSPEVVTSTPFGPRALAVVDLDPAVGDQSLELVFIGCVRLAQCVCSSLAIALPPAALLLFFACCSSLTLSSVGFGGVRTQILHTTRVHLLKNHPHRVPVRRWERRVLPGAALSAVPAMRVFCGRVGICASTVSPLL